MPAKPTKLYPVLGRWIPGQPAAVQVVPTKAEADDLVASGAFTDNPRHRDRDHSAIDLTDTADTEPAEVPEADQPIEAPKPDTLTTPEEPSA